MPVSTCFYYWGEPERAPHRSVVDVGGTSVTCPTIYTTYTVVGWWCELRMHVRQFTLHTQWLLVVQASHA